jgi:4-amino-4-deoxy-L-arabinose transferase-like glycosyltransferase
MESIRVPQTRIWSRIGPRKKEYLALGVVMLLGAILRLYELQTIPVGLSTDEAEDGYVAKRILRGEELPIFIAGSFGEEPMHTYLVALSFSLWGTSLWAVRFFPALIGIATVPVIYWLSKELLLQQGRSSSLVPILSAFFLSTSYWHIIYSRAGLEVVTLPFFSSALLFFLWRGIRTNRHWTFAVSGLILGASLYAYRGARFLPFMLLTFFGGWLVASRDFRRIHLANLALLVAVAVAVYAPLGTYAIAHPEVYFDRELHVSVLNPAWEQGSPLQSFASSLVKTVGMFNFRGDPEFDRNPGRRPALDPVSSLCFFIGLAIALWWWRRPPWLFGVTWLLVMALPVALTAEGLPHFHRGIGALPPLCLLIAVGAAWVKEHLETGIPWRGARIASWTVLGLILASSTALSYRDYFLPWQQRLREGDIIGGSLTEAAEVMNTTRIPDGVWILPASSLRPRNFPYYEVSFLYNGPEPQYTLNMNEETAPTELSEITQGHQRAAVINWKQYVLEEAYLSLDSDPKGLLDFLFRKYGRHIRTEPHRSFDLAVYEIPSSLEPLSADFGGQLQLEGMAFGGSSLQPTSTEEEVERNVLPSGKEGWVVLQWRALQDVETDYKVAVYLLDAQGRVAGQTDRLLLSNDLRPTSFWQPGQLEMDYYTLPSMPGTPPGEYTIEVAVYDAESGARLQLSDTTAGVSSSSLSVGSLQIIKPLAPPQVEPMERLPADETDIAPGMQLLGYDLSARVVGPGETMRIALYWRATEDLTHDYLLSLQLKDGQGDVLLEQEGRPVDGTYPTTQWSNGEIIKDWHDLRLPPDTPSGRYELSLKVLEREETIGQVTLGSVEVSGRPHRFDLPEIQHPLEGRLGDSVLFLGYDLASSEVALGGTLRLTLYWQALEEMQDSYTVFTHLIDAQEQIWGQIDSIPLRGEAPTTSWLPGEILADQYVLLVDPQAPPGKHMVEIGMYDSISGRRLPVTAEGVRVDGDRLLLGEIRVAD